MPARSRGSGWTSRTAAAPGTWPGSGPPASTSGAWPGEPGSGSGGAVVPRSPPSTRRRLEWSPDLRHGWTCPGSGAIAPGASTQAKRWQGFAELARRWDGPVAVLGGPGEEAACAGVVQAVPGAEIAVEAGFLRTLDLLARTRVAVAGDTGLLHLAGAAGARVVALFGPTHPDDGFFAVPGEVVQVDLACRPCTLHRRARCPLGDHACMAEIGVDQVLAAARRQWLAG